MSEKKRKKTPDTERTMAKGAGPRKPVVFEFRRNFVLGIGMMVFTLGWMIVISPLLVAGGSSSIIGYVLLTLVSVVNWALILQALRVVPWASKHVELSRREVTWFTIGGKERTRMRRVIRLRMQTNPLFFFARGLVIYGETADGKQARETVFFGDMGRARVSELKEALEQYL